MNINQLTEVCVQANTETLGESFLYGKSTIIYSLKCLILLKNCPSIFYQFFSAHTVFTNHLHHYHFVDGTFLF